MDKINIEVKINQEEIEHIVQKRVKKIMSRIIREEINKFYPYWDKYRRKIVTKELFKKEGLE